MIKQGALLLPMGRVVINGAPVHIVGRIYDGDGGDAIAEWKPGSYLTVYLGLNMPWFRVVEALHHEIYELSAIILGLHYEPFRFLKSGSCDRFVIHATHPEFAVWVKEASDAIENIHDEVRAKWRMAMKIRKADAKRKGKK